MSFSNPRAVFGIHSIVPIHKSGTSKGLPYGILRVLAGGELSLDADRVDLFGGSNRYAWVSEATTIKSEFKFTCKEYPDFLFELFLGSTTTVIAAEASGFASAITDLVGTSVVDATTGITSVATVTTAADLKYGRYLVKAVSATTVDVYTTAEIDAKKGTDLPFIDDNMKITASALTITSGGTTLIPGTGITLNGGSGAIAFTTGHIAQFDVRPIHTGAATAKIGATGTTFPEFEARMLAQKLSDGRIFEVHAFKCNGSGMPIAIKENEFSEPELTMKLLYDSVEDAVFEYTALSGE